MPGAWEGRSPLSSDRGEPFAVCVYLPKPGRGLKSKGRFGVRCSKHWDCPPNSLQLGHAVSCTVQNRLLYYSLYYFTPMLFTWLFILDYTGHLKQLYTPLPEIKAANNQYTRKYPRLGLRPALRGDPTASHLRYRRVTARLLSLRPFWRWSGRHLSPCQRLQPATVLASIL